MSETNDSTEKLAVLIAIIRAAHIARDNKLKRSAKDELETQFGIRVSFINHWRRRCQGVSDE